MLATEEPLAIELDALSRDVKQLVRQSTAKLDNEDEMAEWAS